MRIRPKTKWSLILADCKGGARQRFPGLQRQTEPTTSSTKETGKINNKIHTNSREKNVLLSLVCLSSHFQGCQIFLGPNMPKWEKYTK
jgi:hypothetical protein